MFVSRGLKIFAFFLLMLALISCARKPVYNEAPAQEDEIQFSIKTLPEGKPVFYSLRHGDTRIDYFVVKINGRVESYFDACGKCYTKKLGYRVENGELVCKACGQRFPMEQVKGIGSCHPLPLTGKTEGNTYIISKQDVIKGARYF
jgi:uncharacterized membrane protein